MENKLIVLAERNILNYLLHIGLKPYAFYTDFEKFKNKSQLFSNNCVILVVFTGSCAFSVKQVCDCIDSLKGRMNNPKDSGVKDIVVFSDFTITRLNDYYMFIDTMLEGVRYNGKNLYVDDNITIIERLKAEAQKVNLLERLVYSPSEKVEEIYLNTSRCEQAYESLRNKPDLDSELRKKIKIPQWKFVDKY